MLAVINRVCCRTDSRRALSDSSEVGVAVVCGSGMYLVGVPCDPFAPGASTQPRESTPYLLPRTIRARTAGTEYICVAEIQPPVVGLVATSS